MNKRSLLHSLSFSDVVINKNSADITQEDSLVLPQPSAHSFNWILGHLVKTRNEILELMGKTPLYDKNKFSIYTPKDFDSGKALNIQDLLNSFRALQPELKAGIESMTDDHLSKPASLTPDKDSGDTVGSIIATVLWHEAYHAGQLGIVRRLVGKEGVIKNPAGE
jgi:uncharacterized damage-inducible protein DinB